MRRDAMVENPCSRVKKIRCDDAFDVEKNMISYLHVRTSIIRLKDSMLQKISIHESVHYVFTNDFLLISKGFVVDDTLSFTDLFKVSDMIIFSAFFDHL